jgi:hypothetical protein
MSAGSQESCGLARAHQHLRIGPDHRRDTRDHRPLAAVPGHPGRRGRGRPVVLVYLAVNIAVIRAFRTEFRDQFRLWRHLLIPAAAD